MSNAIEPAEPQVASFRHDAYRRAADIIKQSWLKGFCTDLDTGLRVDSVRGTWQISCARSRRENSDVPLPIAVMRDEPSAEYLVYIVLGSAAAGTTRDFRGTSFVGRGVNDYTLAWQAVEDCVLNAMECSDELS